MYPRVRRSSFWLKWAFFFYVRSRVTESGVLKQGLKGPIQSQGRVSSTGLAVLSSFTPMKRPEVQQQNKGIYVWLRNGCQGPPPFFV